jgi:hypothetical protein
MLEVVIEKYKPILKIFVFFIVIVSIYFTIFLKKIRKHMVENWGKYKNHPLTMLVSGFIKPVKGESALKTTVKNFIAIITGICKKVFQMLMKPIYAVMKIFLKIFTLLQGILDKIRQQINVIRGFLFKMFEKVMIRIQNSVAAVVYFFLKLREGLKRTLGLFNVMIYSMEHSYMFLQSLVKGPLMVFGHMADKMAMSMSMFTFGVGGIPMWHVAMMMCFDPNTEMKMKSGLIKKIKDIKTGDLLDKNIKVIAVISNNFGKEIDLFNLKGVNVTGDHLVYYKSKFIRVIDHPDIKKGKKTKEIVTLVTDKGIMVINGIIFKDYLDNHDLRKNKYMRRYIEYCLNDKKINPNKNNKCNDLLDGFKSLEYIDNLNEITGIVKIAPNTLDIYSLNNYELSGNMLVYHSKKWIRVADHKDSKFIGRNRVIFYHLISRTEKIHLKNNLIARDFTETRDSIINTHIDNYME